MADDGMLMNFAIDTGPLKPKPIFKGGRWKDRLQAKKSLQRSNGGRPHGSLTGPNTVAPVKARQFVQDRDGESAAKKQKTSNSDATPQQNGHTNTHPKPTNGDVISSLYTSNPSATSKPILFKPSDAAEATPTNPSNAPLPAALHNFTSLGLSPTLSAHLLQSLSLSAPTAIQKAAITQLLQEDSDAFIQAETGSGKTLAYLLPIIQRILSLTRSSGKHIDRQSGLFALILAPTRELTHQISTVLTTLLQKSPHIVAGQVTGGATKNHEKARLRKGLNILVATPGRLADHLENTEVLDLAKVRWLVLDEGDRLVEMGFEEEVRKVVKALDGKREAMEGKIARLRKEGKVWGGAGPEGKVFGGRVPLAPGGEVKGLPARRTTVLCSATMKMGVQRLGEISLKDAVLIKAEDAEEGPTAAVPMDMTETVNGATAGGATADGTILNGDGFAPAEKAFLAPAQLKQSYIIAPAKQRLVTLAALLKWTFARRGSVQKAIVFLSSADSVEFHFEVFARKTREEREAAKADTASQPPKKDPRNGQKKSIKHTDSSSPPPASSAYLAKAKAKDKDLPTTSPASSLTSPTNPSLTLYKLHGSLTQQLRTSTLESFRKTPNPSILLCTDVASRGLDLPNIDLVIEYDPPFSGEEHLHRVGRTARAGKEGRAICFLMPGCEEKYVEVLKEGSGGGNVKGEGAEDVLRKGFTLLPVSQNSDVLKSGGGKWDTLATDWQLDIERWIVEHQRAAEMARKAFVSHVRAYATHVARERYMFDVKELHLGHMAKAFALREKPGSMGRGGVGGGRKDKAGSRKRTRGSAVGDGDAPGAGDTEKQARKADHDIPSNEGQDAARKMYAKMREQMAGGAGEFNIG